MTAVSPILCRSRFLPVTDTFLSSYLEFLRPRELLVFRRGKLQSPILVPCTKRFAESDKRPANNARRKSCPSEYIDALDGAGWESGWKWIGHELFRNGSLHSWFTVRFSPPSAAYPAPFSVPVFLFLSLFLSLSLPPLPLPSQTRLILYTTLSSSHSDSPTSLPFLYHSIVFESTSLFSACGTRDGNNNDDDEFHRCVNYSSIMNETASRTKGNRRREIIFQNGEGCRQCDDQKGAIRIGCEGNEIYRWKTINIHRLGGVYGGAHGVNL